MVKHALNGVVQTLIVMVLSSTVGLSVAVAAPLKVVTSFSILNDLVQQVGGDKISSVAIVGAESDAHSFEPRPSDAKTLQEAELLIINGADFEAWLPKLVQAAGYEGKIIEATKGVPLRPYAPEAEHGHSHGSYDPHAWQSLEHAQLYVHNIRDALMATDPQNKDYYQQQAQAYVQAMVELHTRFLHAFEQLPAAQRTVVSSHDAFGYLGQAYGVHFLSLLGASNQAEPSAKELADLIKYMRRNQVSAVFIENTSSPKLVEQIARETDAVLGEHLYSDALAKSPHPADTYLGMMRWNAEALLEALQP